MIGNPLCYTVSDMVDLQSITTDGHCSTTQRRLAGALPCTMDPSATSSRSFSMSQRKSTPRFGEVSSPNHMHPARLEELSRCIRNILQSARMVQSRLCRVRLGPELPGQLLRPPADQPLHEREHRVHGLRRGRGLSHRHPERTDGSPYVRLWDGDHVVRHRGAQQVTRGSGAVA